MVLPDGPATRGAATSWRVYLVSLSEGAFALPLIGIMITPVLIRQLIWEGASCGRLSCFEATLLFFCL
jgi:hypothetical protein